MSHLLTRLLPLAQSGLLRGSPLTAQSTWSLLRSLSTRETTKEELSNFLSQHEVRVLGGTLTDLIQRFSDAPFGKTIVSSLQNHYQEPTPIQSIAWPVALSGKDLVGLAHTGTGKTLGFLLPAFKHIQEQRKANKDHSPSFKIQPKVLVLAPTRELAIQISNECQRFEESAKISSAVVFGGQQVRSQLPPLLRQNKIRPIDLLVGTPGRLIDLLQNHAGIVDISQVTFAVLDEADRMLDMGFEPQVREILSAMPGAKINDPQDGSENPAPPIQTMMWSATWPKEVRMLAADFLRDHLTVRVGSDELQAPTTITQSFEYCLQAHRFDRLQELLNQWRRAGDCKVLIFCEKKLTVDFLQEMLNSAGIRARGMHGDKTQSFRENTLASFRREKQGVLIATEVAARGLDVSDITHVVNYETPLQAESYVHRIGRTGRAGAKGIAHTFFDSAASSIAKDLIEVLTTSGQEIPAELLALKQLNAPSRPQKPRTQVRPDFRRQSLDSRSRFNDRSASSRFGDRFGGDRYGGFDRFGGDRYGGGDRFGSDRFGSDRFGGDRYGSEDRYSEDRRSDRYGEDRVSRRFDAYGDDEGSQPRFGKRLSEAASSSSSRSSRSRFDSEGSGRRSRVSMFADDDEEEEKPRRKSRASEFDRDF